MSKHLKTQKRKEKMIGSVRRATVEVYYGRARLNSNLPKLTLCPALLPDLTHPGGVLDCGMESLGPACNKGRSLLFDDPLLFFSLKVGQASALPFLGSLDSLFLLIHIA